MRAQTSESSQWRRLGVIGAFLLFAPACKNASQGPAPSASTADETPAPPASVNHAPPSETRAGAAAGASGTPRHEPANAKTSEKSVTLRANELELANEVEAKPKTHVYRVAAVGDSLTDARSNGGKYLAHLRKRCPKSIFDNYGKGGDMVNQMRRRFESEVLTKREPDGSSAYTHLIVYGGVNDLYSDLTANRTNDRIQRDLTAMYEAGQQLGMQVIAITVSPWGGFSRYFNQRRSENTLALNAWIEAQGRAGRVDTVVDSYPLLSCGDPEKLCDDYAKPFRDGLHFGPRGHERLGKALFEAAFSDCE